MKKVLSLAVIGIFSLVLTGCGNTTLSCTQDGDTYKYELKDGKIVKAWENGKAVSKSELDDTNVFFKDKTNKETEQAIRDLVKMSGGSCK